MMMMKGKCGICRAVFAKCWQGLVCRGRNERRMIVFSCNTLEERT